MLKFFLFYFYNYSYLYVTSVAPACNRSEGVIIPGNPCGNETPAPNL